ncbi:cysteine-rich venom protein TEL1 [Silurus meridionalis]|uniref:cysteine-rich venom protein TEL1 n=1 Tax=Silurus meridionalis TaxID=175797 RepID=UPI001EEBC13E|nr:cysteine-rich venom protein TEL1 [Silurus meridionalis]
MFLRSLCALALLQMSLTCSVPDQICTTLQAVQDEIVNIHNMFRRQVDPPASNMLMMSWSSEVAAIAQKWADTCSMEHGPPSSRMLGSYEMGENLLEGSPVISWTDVITEWHSEVANYNYSSGSGNGKPIGHYTQVVWFGSYQVGCGVAKCGGAYFYDCQYYRQGITEVWHHTLWENPVRPVHKHVTTNYVPIHALMSTLQQLQRVERKCPVLPGPETVLRG